MNEFIHYNIIGVVSTVRLVLSVPQEVMSLMNCNNTPRKRRVRLTDYQQAFVKPAIGFLQLGAGLYLGDLLKPYMLPIVMVSFSIVAVIALQVWKKTW
jgi:hypothetical protein